MSTKEETKPAGVAYLSKWRERELKVTGLAVEELAEELEHEETETSTDEEE